MHIGQVKVGTFVGQDMCVCSEGSRLQLHHKTAFILKVETGDKEGGKDGRKVIGQLFHSCDRFTESSAFINFYLTKFF